MKKFARPVAIRLMDKIIYKEGVEFFHQIVKGLEIYRTTPIPGFKTKSDTPGVEAEFNLRVFVEAILEKNENIIQITIVCRALRISAEDLILYLPAGSGEKLLARIIGQPLR